MGRTRHGLGKRLALRLITVAGFTAAAWAIGSGSANASVPAAAPDAVPQPTLVTVLDELLGEALGMPQAQTAQPLREAVVPRARIVPMKPLHRPYRQIVRQIAARPVVVPSDDADPITSVVVPLLSPAINAVTTVTEPVVRAVEPMTEPLLAIPLTQALKVHRAVGEAFVAIVAPAPGTAAGALAAAPVIAAGVLTTAPGTPAGAFTIEPGIPAGVFTTRPGTAAGALTTRPEAAARALTPDTAVRVPSAREPQSDVDRHRAIAKRPHIGKLGRVHRVTSGNERTAEDPQPYFPLNDPLGGRTPMDASTLTVPGGAQAGVLPAATELAEPSEIALRGAAHRAAERLVGDAPTSSPD